MSSTNDAKRKTREGGEELQDKYWNTQEDG